MRTPLTFLLLTLLPTFGAAQESSLKQALTQISSVGNGGFGHENAITSWNTISKANVDQVPAILAAIKSDNELAANWLRSAADQILERHGDTGKPLPAKALEKIVFDQAYAPRARRLAYEWLRKVDDTAATRIVPKMLNDSSLEMRRDAVALAISKASDADDSNAAKLFRVALTAARDFDQVESIQESLEKLGEDVDLQSHFGFLVNWKLIGPFDNTDKSGFEVAYGPEKDLATKPTYKGKKGDVNWEEHTTKDKYGAVDLNEVIGKNMGAITYAYTEFQSDKPQQVDVRLVSKNATKIWVNGEQVMSNEVYHSGSKFDQYISQANLKRGKNTILMKVCQNEQEESWAQDWKFQLRICDELGTAIKPASK